MYRSIITGILFLLPFFGFSQADWISYVKKEKKGIMAVSVDLELDLNKPKLHNVLIVGTRVKGCYKNGFPNEEGIKYSDVFSDSVAFRLNKITKNRKVGMISYQCLIFDVFYVKDTLGIRKEMDTLLSKNYPHYPKYVVISKDKKWDYYYQKLFPPVYTEDFIYDQEILYKLVSAGDDLSTERNVKHWTYFKNEKRRNSFVSKIKKLDFKVDSLNIKKDLAYPYEVQIYRKEKIYPRSIESVTALLNFMVKADNGLYDGWGAEMIVKE
ncbi:MAG: hypothetical protein DSY82_00045 [Flavobacteriia bacterium]|nr:MAG: hypothetical protein DSY82_00045 [Flavobacteriia bacterium]